ncbi:xanthine dehydrogenase family protein molybdopterin-binding subunit [Synergistes jonesii]|uniref:xanthine dehydrogenase family protein molybdopterin-binding subunit n=1 Tax=Synergistes jonesii TaxID=2754 RepID=UPI00242F7687|nr:xanthine dehydrogenase family protein molybdopterin-binding subunit [Synergistes jonesii]
MYRVIGKSHPLIDGVDKVTGRHLFGSDFCMSGMLSGAVLRSHLPHARIRNIDTSEAEKVPGVRAVVTGKDIEMPYYSVAGVKKLDEQILAYDKVRYVGDEIAIAAADTLDAAREAVSKIKVDLEELPAVFDMEEAMLPSAPILHEQFGSNIANVMNVNHGDIERALDEAALVVEGDFSSGRIHHGYIEPNAGVALWAGDKITFWLPTQSPVLARMTYAKALGVRRDQVRVVQLPLGGGFGGKLEYKLHPLCAILSKFTGKPVKIVNTRQEEMDASLPRVPIKLHMQLAVSAKGRFIGKKSRLLCDNGAYMNYGIGIQLSATTRSDNLYRIKNIRTESYLVYTNSMPTGAFRGFGCPQSHFAQETLIDEAAVKLGIDSAELRLMNASQRGDVTPHNWRLGSCGFSDCIKRSVEAAGWHKKKEEYALTRKDKWSKGIGIASCLHVSGNRTFLPFFDGSSALVRISEEGRVIIFPGEVDIGQGSKTLFAMIAAEELGIPVEWISVVDMDTDTCPHGMGTFGDRVTTLGGNAVKNAAIDARRQLFASASKHLHSKPEELRSEDGDIVSENGERIGFAEAAELASYEQAGATIIGRGDFQPPNVSMVDPVTKAGNISCAYPFVTQIVELAVNRGTGEVKLLNIVSSHDLGKALNPMMAEGQVHGAVAMGIGFALCETMIEKNGAVANQSFKHGYMPRATDMPSLTSLLIESNDPNGPYGGKGLGEPALTAIAPAIANAIYDAVGVRMRSLPITPEALLKAIKNKKSD